MAAVVTNNKKLERASVDVGYSHERWQDPKGCDNAPFGDLQREEFHECRFRKTVLW